MEVNNNVMNNSSDANELHSLRPPTNATKLRRSSNRAGQQNEQQQTQQHLAMCCNSSGEQPAPPRQQANARERCRTHRYAIEY